MRIMFTISLGIYCQVQTQPSIGLLKEQKIIGAQEHNLQQENSFRTLLRSTMTWYHQNNGLIQTPRMLKFLH